MKINLKTTLEDLIRLTWSKHDDGDTLDLRIDGAGDISIAINGKFLKTLNGQQHLFVCDKTFSEEDFVVIDEDEFEV